MRVFIPKTASTAAALLATATIGIMTAGPAVAATPHPAAACTDTPYGQQIPKNVEGTEVEWTANSCNYLIQERTWCSSTVTPTGEWETSGVVKATYLWDASRCSDGYAASRGEERISQDDGKTWGAYTTFWPSSS